MAIRKPREVVVSPAGTLNAKQLMDVVVYAPKDRKQATASGAYSRFGRVHNVVFSPDGRRVVGIMVKRPDVVAMVAVADAFVALDALGPCDGGLRVTRGRDAYDELAQERLGLDWDRCIIWVGMDVRSQGGRKLGFVENATFKAWEGDVVTFGVGDGNAAESLVGHLEIPVDMMQGYQDGWMIADDEAAKMALSGGVAAKAGEGYAKAKVAGKEAAEKAGEAVAEGSRALGKQLGRTKGMFGAFMDEYKKASK